VTDKPIRQLRLKLAQTGAYTFDAFVRGPSNADAWTALHAWPNWHGGALALVGPEGSGKTHLARAWAQRTNAVVLDRTAPDLSPGRRALLEDVDQGVPDETLFHLINLAAQPGGGLLLTARKTPALWTTTLPDLRSRLNALQVAEIETPDDGVLEGVLRRFFRERNIRPPEEVYPYLLRRISRSTLDAREIVRRLDEAGDAEFKPVTRVLARQVLEGDNENLDLFE
jgi:chromosomal replication initiation ATPase DnaA